MTPRTVAIAPPLIVRAVAFERMVSAIWRPAGEIIFSSWSKRFSLAASWTKKMREIPMRISSSGAREKTV